MTIKFTDGEGNEWTLQAEQSEEGRGGCLIRSATPDDLARAGYTPSTENAEVQRLCLEAAKRTRELEALRALEAYVRDLHANERPHHQTAALLKAIDEARK